MKVAAITITYNRLELTKQTGESFGNQVDFHLFIDNGSTDGTTEYLRDFNHILLEKNYGIAHAFRLGVNYLKDYDFILKLDNDIETITDDIINKMLYFYKSGDMRYVCSPVDLNIDEKFAPPSLGYSELNGFDIQFVTHTGGAFQLIPYSICKRLCDEYRHLKAGDYMIGKYFRRQGYKPIYLLDLQMKHIGLNYTCKDYIL